MENKRSRRPKKDILKEKINKIDEKMNSLAEQKNILQSQLDEIEAAERKAKEESDMKELLALMSKKGVNIDQLKKMLSETN